MGEDILHFSVGAQLQLQAANSESAPRYAVKVIGCLHGTSLVVTTPVVQGRVQLVREGQSFNVRMLQGSSVMGFAARVLASSLKPYPHLHLEYPSVVESIVVRNAQRVSAGLPVTVRNTRSPDEPQYRVAARLQDLSSTGAKVSYGRPLAQVGDMLQLDFSLQVAGQTEALTLVAAVRNVFERGAAAGSNDGQSYGHGVQFRSINRFQQLLLHGWVLERTVVDMSPAQQNGGAANQSA